MQVYLHCPSVVLTTVVMPMVCANLTVFQQQVSSVWLVTGCVLSLIRIAPDAGVPSHCPSVVLTTVVMPMVCVSLTIFQQQVSSVWLVTGCVLSLIRIAPDAGVPSHCPSVVLTTVVMPMVCASLTYCLLTTGEFSMVSNWLCAVFN